MKINIRYLSDKEIEQGIQDAESKYGSDYPPGTDAAFHQHHDCIRLAYTWLDAQKKTKSVCHQVDLKHIIENWAGRYVSSSDVLVAASLHPDIMGSYPRFNISKIFTHPSSFRRLGIGEANKHRSVKGDWVTSGYVRLTYGKIEVVENGEFHTYRIPKDCIGNVKTERLRKLEEINIIEFGIHEFGDLFSELWNSKSKNKLEDLKATYAVDLIN